MPWWRASKPHERPLQHLQVALFRNRPRKEQAGVENFPKSSSLSSPANNERESGLAPPAGSFVTGRFARFLAVGAAAAAVNILSRALISYFVRFEYAVALAFPIATTFAFMMSRTFVFERSRRAVWDEYFRFL